MRGVFVLLCLAASAYAIHMPSQHCANQETYYTIYQVPSHNCKCTATHAGALRYRNGKLQICNGRQYENVGGAPEPYGSHDNPGKSCRDILNNRRGARSGMYYIKAKQVTMRTYCYMGSICGSSGWTMIMKADGNKGTFRYDSPYWTNRQSYNIVGAARGLDRTETKLDTYSHFPLSRLCLGLRTGGTLRWKELDFRASSLYALIADNRFRATDMGRDYWKHLVPDSSLQRNCNREGFNVRVGNAAKARIGIISNNENDCHSPDSRIAIGGQGSACGQKNDNSVGNEAKCSPDNSDKSIRSFAYVFAKAPARHRPLGTYDNPASSCKTIKARRPRARNGVYYLNLRGNKYTRVYCHMDVICGSSGWTMLMKINGHASTFRYESLYWTNHNEYNIKAVFGGLNTEEMKLRTYSTLRLNNLCLGMKTGGHINWLRLGVKGSPSLYSIIASNHFRATHIKKNDWKKLVPKSSLQPHCNRQGFNNNPVPGKPAAKVRIGIVANQENDCKSPDSRIGFGASGTFCGQKSYSAGNEARCGGDLGDRHIPAMGFILAQ